MSDTHSQARPDAGRTSSPHALPSVVDLGCKMSEGRAGGTLRVALPAAGLHRQAVAVTPGDRSMCAMKGYGRPELLADPDWLWEHRDDPNVRVVDCATSDAYDRAHIPSALRVPGHP